MRDFDIVVYGATGFTGRLVAEHLLARYGTAGPVRWAMAGRSAAKLEQVRADIGAPESLPLIVADADDPASLTAMAARTRAVITTVGPYQLYGEPLVAACVAEGADYLDLAGEPLWMAAMIAKYDEAARASGARILFSCGFDSIPFELGVFYVQSLARQQLGQPAPRVLGRVRDMRGTLSGGTAASGRATMAAVQADPALMALLFDPFALTPGFKGADQPRGTKPFHDEIIGADVGPFGVAIINTKNVHRSNWLQNTAYGADFQYEEMAIVAPGKQSEFPSLAAEDTPKPGEGPSREEREAGYYDLLFVAVAADGRQVRARVHGDRDPGYGSTSKLIAETALCLLEAPDVKGGIWVPGAALGARLIARLSQNAGLSFTPETSG